MKKKKCKENEMEKFFKFYIQLTMSKKKKSMGRATLPMTKFADNVSSLLLFFPFYETMLFESLINFPFPFFFSSSSPSIFVLSKLWAIVSFPVQWILNVVVSANVNHGCPSALFFNLHPILMLNVLSFHMQRMRAHVKLYGTS